MNLRMARVFVLFTGFLALCSVGAAALLGLRLHRDRITLHELRQAGDCGAPVPAAQKGR